MIGLQCAQESFQVCLGALAGAMSGFRGEENVFAELRDHGPVYIFGAAICVGARHVEIVDAEGIGAAHYRFGFLERHHAETRAALPDDSELLARSS